MCKFGARWWLPCKDIAPVFGEFEQKYPDLIFMSIDYDDEECEDLVQQFKIVKLPTFVVIKNAKEVKQDRFQGTNKETLQTIISKYFKVAVQSAFSMSEDF